MRFSVRLLLPTALFVLALAPSAAHADPLVVTGGTIQYNFARGAFRSGGGSVRGDGFIVGFANPDGSSQSGLSAQCAVLPCAPGTVVNTSGSIFPDNNTAFGRAPSTINGVTYSLTIVGGQLNFTGADVALPDVLLDTVVLSTPFTMSGNITVSAFIDGSFQGVFSSELVGSGTAFLIFVGGSDGYRLQSYRYVFADPSAVPEPATMLLLATGLAGVAAKARKRRKA